MAVPYNSSLISHHSVDLFLQAIFAKTFRVFCQWNEVGQFLAPAAAFGIAAFECNFTFRTFPDRRHSNLNNYTIYGKYFIVTMSLLMCAELIAMGKRNKFMYALDQPHSKKKGLTP
jgi:hypothetical protein